MTEMPINRIYILNSYTHVLVLRKLNVMIVLLRPQFENTENTQTVRSVNGYNFYNSFVIVVNEMG